MDKKAKFISVPEAAKVLKISRIAVFKNVQKGKIPAVRIGRNWAIPADFKIPPPTKKSQVQKYHERTKKTIFGKKERKIKQSGQKKSFPVAAQFTEPVDTLSSMGWD